MTVTKKKAKPTSPSWSDVKTKLKSFDEAGLLSLIKDLYAANKDIQAFLHSRLEVGDAPLAPYKKTISRWINPNLDRNQDISISKAKKAISDYKKAVGAPAGMAELCIYFCEEAFVLLDDCGMDDESYYMSLVNMFEQAMQWVTTLAESDQPPLLERMESVRAAGQDLGYGVGSDFNDIWFEMGLSLDDE